MGNPKRKDMHLGAQHYLFRNARILRNQRTEAEKVLWEELREKKVMNVKFRQQHPVFNYVVDFYSNELGYVIEIDGLIHLEYFNRLYDRERDNQLRSHGVFVDRFTNEEVLNQLDSVLHLIKSRIIMFRMMKVG